MTKFFIGKSFSFQILLPKRYCSLKWPLKAIPTFLMLLLLLVSCMSHASDVISFQARRSRAHANSSATFALWPNVFHSTSLVVSRQAILCRLLDLLPFILPCSAKHSILSLGSSGQEMELSFSDCWQKFPFRSCS